MDNVGLPYCTPQDFFGYIFSNTNSSASCLEICALCVINFYRGDHLCTVRSICSSGHIFAVAISVLLDCAGTVSEDLLDCGDLWS